MNQYDNAFDASLMALDILEREFGKENIQLEVPLQSMVLICEDLQNGTLLKQYLQQSLGLLYARRRVGLSVLQTKLCAGTKSSTKLACYSAKMTKQMSSKCDVGLFNLSSFVTV